MYSVCILYVYLYIVLYTCCMLLDALAHLHARGVIHTGMFSPFGFGFGLGLCEFFWVRGGDSTCLFGAHKHTHGYIYILHLNINRDLKLGNLFLDKHMRIKVRPSHTGHARTTACLPLHWHWHWHPPAIQLIHHKSAHNTTPPPSHTPKQIGGRPGPGRARVQRGGAQEDHVRDAQLHRARDPRGLGRAGGGGA